MNLKVRLEVNVKISDEMYEKLEAEGTLQDHLEETARKKIEYFDGRVSFFDGSQQILEDKESR
jgi:hypothetical protein